MAWTGINLAIYTGLLVHMISESIIGGDSNLKLEMAMYSMISLGVGEILGSQIVGQVIDKAGNRVTSLLIITIIII